MSLFPNNLDTNLEIPLVQDGVTEISSETINALRDAVFAIEKALGIDIQGNKNDLVTRINLVIDANGSLKTSALDGKGLVSLPIGDVQIATNAAIQESKLDLDYSTQTLKNLISSLQTDVNALSSSILSASGSLNGHILGTSNFHDGYQIKMPNGVGGLSSTNVGSALVEIADYLFSGISGISPHIDLNLPSTIKHIASDIKVSSVAQYSVLDMVNYDLQSVVENIDTNLNGQSVKHIDNFHSNGILKQINSGTYYNSNQARLTNSGISYTIGSSIATIPGVADGGQPSFSDLRIYPGSILSIDSGVVDSGNYQIIEVGPQAASGTLGDIPSLDSNQIYVNHIFNDTVAEVDASGFTIYDPASISSEDAPLACSVKNNETIVDSISILNPNAARVVSLGFNGDILGVDGYELRIEAGIDSGVTRTITIPDLNKKRLGAHAGLVDAQSVAERINAYVSDPTLGNHFPISAFKVGNELAIAHNLVGSKYTLKILSANGNYPLGFDASGSDVEDRVIYGNANNSFNINGTSISAPHTTFSGTSTLPISSVNIPLYDVYGSLADPTVLGINPGDVIHVTGHSTTDANGSYTIESVTSSYVTLFAGESIAADASFDVKITNSFVSLYDLQSITESDLGLASLYVNEDGYSFYKQRAKYSSLNNVEIINLSDNFPIGDVTVLITNSGDNRNFNIVYNSIAGDTVTVHKDFNGTFKLYHTNNVDYAILKVTDKDIAATSTTLTVYRTLNYDEAMEIALVHFDGSISITNIIDKRLFGNMGPEQIRNDFIEIYCQRPFGELRSDGVIRGFELMSMDYSDGYTGMHAIPLTGGIAYVNGTRCEVATQKVVLQSYNENYTELDGYRVIGINEFGTIRAYSDELGEILSDGYNSDVQFGKILPLYRVTLVAGLPYSVVDIRRFTNKIDEKLEVIVDGTNNRVGNFKTLEGALLYAASYPSNEKLTVKILNEVTTSETILVPEGVSIIGGARFGGGRHKIINNTDLDDHFIILQDNCRLENLEIASSTVQMNGALVLINGSNTSIENCLLHFTDNDSISSSNEDIGIQVGYNATNYVRIRDNRIDNVFAGIVSSHGVENIDISDNFISGIYGTLVETYGIGIGSWARTCSNTIVKNNTISVPSVNNSDIRGINVDVDSTMSLLRIENNSITHSAGNTMTNGIRIENVNASGNLVEELFVQNNNIYGIERDDNDIWGIWVSNTDVAKVSNNTIRNIGQSGNTDVGFIGVGQNVGFVRVSNNTLKDGNANYGIYKETTTVSTDRCVIAENSLSNLGSQCYCIYGTTAYSSIENNFINGTSQRGIQWSGAYSKICGNNIGSVSGVTSFTNAAIYTTASDLDISENTINHLSSGSLGIITNTGRNRIKITGNTIFGQSPASSISIYGFNHIVSNNKLSSTSSPLYISLTGVTNSLFEGNFIAELGAGTTAFSASGTTTGNAFIGNTIIGNLINGFYLPSVEDCFFNGNKTPDSVTNTIGVTPTSSTINTNLIGVNRGVLDTVGLPIASGVSSSSIAGANDWELSTTNQYWSPSASAQNYKLYFPITGIPNGARLVSVDVSGYNPADLPGGTLTLDVYQKSMKSTFASQSIATVPVTISPGDLYFGPGQSTSGEISISTTDDINVINYEESNYYIVITTGVTIETTAAIHGITINFRY